MLNSAVALLTSGDKCFASKYSSIGDIGYTSSRFGYPELLKRLHLEQAFITSGEKKVKLNPYEEMKAEDKEW